MILPTSADIQTLREGGGVESYPFHSIIKNRGSLAL
jgi:hypothetical protein